MIIRVGNHEVDIDEKIVEAYRRTIPNKLEVMAELYLNGMLNEDDTEKIFREYNPEEIKSAIERAAMEEIKVCGGTV